MLFFMFVLGFVLAISMTYSLLSDSKTASGSIVFDWDTPAMNYDTGIGMTYTNEQNENGIVRFNNVGDSLNVSIDDNNLDINYYMRIEYIFESITSGVSFTEGTYSFSDGTTSMSTPVETASDEGYAFVSNSSTQVRKGVTFDILSQLSNFKYTGTDITDTKLEVVVYADTTNTFDRDCARNSFVVNLSASYTNLALDDTYSIYVCDGSDLTKWYSDRVSTYDPVQALMASSMWNDATDSLVSKYSDNTGSLNIDYGTINSFLGKTSNEEGQWNVYIFNIEDELVRATEALGWYSRFNDYDPDFQAANIILYYGSSSTPAILVSAIFENNAQNVVERSSLADVTETEEYAVYFNLMNYSSSSTAIIDGSIFDTEGKLVTDLALKQGDGVQIVGYGSNAYLALKNALGSNNIIGEDKIPYNEYFIYSKIGSIFGLESQQIAGQDTQSDVFDDIYLDWWIYEFFKYSPSGGVITQYAKALYSYSPLIDAGEMWTRKEFTIVYKEDITINMPAFE